MSFIVIDQVSGKAVQVSVVEDGVELHTGTAVCDSAEDVWKLLEAMYGPDDSFWRNRFVPTEVGYVTGPQVHWPTELDH